MSTLRNIAKHPTIALIDSFITLKELKQIHTQLVINGLLNNRELLGQFVASIAVRNPTNLLYSNQILDQCAKPTLFALNSMIRAYSKSLTPHKSFQFYNKILQSNDVMSPDNYTFNFLVRTCAQSACEAGPAVHGALIKHGFEYDPHVESGLIFMYAEMSCLSSCHRVFESVQKPDLVCQTTMVSACAKCGDIGFARNLFDSMPQRDFVSWNAMIAGYAQRGQSREALNLFKLMQMDGVKVNEVSMISVVTACTHLGALDQGKWAHAYIEKNKIQMTVNLGTALVDMYFKCGNVDRALKVFWEMNEKNVYTWSTAIGGLAMNGYGQKCLELFSFMKHEGIAPNEITFISVLKGCSVVGFVDEGRSHFDSMKRDHGIEPRLEHYGCMVDLYGRAGRLEEALNFINTMPLKPHAGAWGALLNACRMYKNMELGEFASRKLIEVEGKNHGAYVSLSNIYADTGNWDRVSNVRQSMKAEGISKLPGCSVMEVNGEVHEFFSGDKSHPSYDVIETMWGEISKRLKLAGYVASTNSVLFDIEEEEKEDALCKHSEKMAIAFGLFSLKEGLPIRIVKNLRICWDCHDVSKMISKIFEREIIVRDRNRFHHFKDGECSCKDFW
ncbi:putative pentatricopeptide repeat-containing protein At5g40405 [Cucumis sativus]|nr:putative pentatricopeptide repeat-containing protein At5g40405 [Cucumis sativus]